MPHGTKSATTPRKDIVNVPVSAVQMHALREHRPKDVGRAIERAIDIGLAIADTPKPFLAILAAVAHRNHSFEWIPSASSADRREFYRTKLDNDIVNDAHVMAKARAIHFTDMLEIAMAYGTSCYKCKKSQLFEMLKADRKGPTMRGMLPDGKTFAGMAYFAGTGPDNARCKDCAHYINRVSPFTGKELRGECGLYKTMMEVSNAPKFPKEAHACKEFEERKNTP